MQYDLLDLSFLSGVKENLKMPDFFFKVASFGEVVFKFVQSFENIY